MKNITTLILLLALTFLATLVANTSLGGGASSLIILTLAMVKILLVAFQFMDLKDASLFWQGALVSTVVIFIATFSAFIF